MGKMETLWTEGARLHGIGSLFPIDSSSPIAHLRDSEYLRAAKALLTQLSPQNFPGAHWLPEPAQPTPCVPATKNTTPRNQRRTFLGHRPWHTPPSDSRCCAGLKAHAVLCPLQYPAGKSKHLPHLQEVLPLTVSANGKEDLKESVTPPG